MSKIQQHLKKHLAGTVLETPAVLKHFSTDGSILEQKPRLVVYPRNTADVHKVVRLSWLLAERGKILPITARGKGTDEGGAALGSGIILAFPAYMYEPVELTPDTVTVEPGMLLGDLQRTLTSHQRFLPPMPANAEVSTVGGAVANNASGPGSFKYGSLRDYVERLEVVLANGKAVTVQKLNAKAVDKKKGQMDLEGEIYRKLDGLLIDNADLLQQTRPLSSASSSGYHLWDVRAKDGSLDLTKLFVGSQGTLGIITEATLKTAPYLRTTRLLAVYFDDLDKANQAIMNLLELKPSALEALDGGALTQLVKQGAARSEELLPDTVPKLMLLLAFDDKHKSARARKAKKAQKLLKNLAYSWRVVEPDEQARYWQLRAAAAQLGWSGHGPARALPLLDGSLIPPAKTAEFLRQVHALFKKHHLEPSIWGSVGLGSYNVRPQLNLGNVGDRQRVFTLMDDYYKLIIKLGGSLSGGCGDGRLRTPYLAKQYPPELVELFSQVKAAFDPHNTLNPGVKVGTSQEDLRGLVRDEYTQAHHYDHLPGA